MEKLLGSIYYNVQDPGAYGGVDRLLRRARELGHKDITREEVKQYLADQHTYSLHKPARRHYKRNATVVGGIDSQWQADLCDMQQLAKYNDKMHYILTVIDILSKFAWAVAVKDKSSKTVTAAFASVLESAKPRVPKKLQTDKGKEFFNKDFAALMRARDIHLFASESDQKAAVVERFNRTLKTRIWTFFSAKRTSRWVDDLPGFLEAYNHSYHRSIGMAPADVTEEDENRIWGRLYGKECTVQGRKGGDNSGVPEVGGKVRLNKFKGIFEKGYLPNWTAEDFQVTKTVGGRKRPLYKLKDNTGEDISGTFYPEEVQKIKENKYFIEKIIKRRKLKDGTKQLLVKWENWPEKFNSWINEGEIQNGANG